MSARHFDRSDADWIVLIRRRDSQAIIDLNQICLRVCLWHFSGWIEIDPREAATDALIKIIHDVDRPGFRIRSSFEGYAYQTTSRLCFDIKRRIHCERELFQTTPSETLAQAPAPAAGDEVSVAKHAALHSVLRACIEQLAADDQRLIGWYGEGFGPSAIALKLGPPATANNVGVRLHRLRRTIRRCMEACGHVPMPGL